MKISATSIALVLGLAIAAQNGCSSDDTSSTPTPTGGDAATGTDAQASDGASSDTGATSDAGKADAIPAGECNALENDAPEATSATVKGNAPTATGGTIAEGTYFLTAFTLYDPAGDPEDPSPSGLQVTLAISGKQMDSIQTLPDGSTDTFAETFEVDGTKLDRTLSCPKTGPDLAAVYSVDGNKLTIYETDPQSGLVAGSLYVKQ